MFDLKKSFFGLFCVTLISLTIWLSILISINPYTTDVITRITFFASLLFWISGLISFIIIYFATLVTFKSPVYTYQTSILHSFIISVAIVSIITLEALNVLGIIEVVIIALISCLAELMLMTQRGNNGSA